MTDSNVQATDAAAQIVGTLLGHCAGGGHSGNTSLNIDFHSGVTVRIRVAVCVCIGVDIRISVSIRIGVGIRVNICI